MNAKVYAINSAIVSDLTAAESALARAVELQRALVEELTVALRTTDDPMRRIDLYEALVNAQRRLAYWSFDLGMMTEDLDGHIEELDAELWAHRMEQRLDALK